MARDFVAEILGWVEASAPTAPEAVSVLVVAPGGVVVDAELAGQAGPLVAARLYPGRSFGAALHVEPGVELGTFEVAVEVTHPFSAARIGVPAPAVSQEV